MQIGSMRIGVVTMPKPLSGGPSTVERIGHIAREVERLGFAGLWTTDAIGRGWPTADPLTWLASAVPHTAINIWRSTRCAGAGTSHACSVQTNSAHCASAFIGPVYAAAPGHRYHRRRFRRPR